MTLEEYFRLHETAVTQPSERLFIEEFVYPLVGAKVDQIVPQQPFLDRTGRHRRIDFVYHGQTARLALEVNGETYHAEGIIPNEMFDDNLFRQNEILRAGYKLLRFSYNQLQAPQWRPIVHEYLRDFFATNAPELLREYALTPTPLQRDALDALAYYRDQRGWAKGVVVLPTGTGKTVLSALDAHRFGGRVLFLVHRLDILKQSVDAYRMVWPDLDAGVLTGEERSRVNACKVLFASKDTLRQPTELSAFERSWFNYIVVDEVHHGQSPSYREILDYFRPQFMLGMTATPDRMDRRDIFELFDYNKVFEVPLQEAIERGFLVPYTYYGLTDNVDYSRIRFQNHRYRVDDLERLLIIPERNEAILKEYREKGRGDKAIGFCVSIHHANRMAELFQANGISAAAIHSESPDRDSLIADFRANKLQVVFTVDLFNEGVDFPNVRVVLFLRPTESKTVFVQQLGRGLRLSLGKDRLLVLDFIGNYQRANQIRKYLATGSQVVTTNNGNGRRRKIEYTYSTGCQVIFDPAVEEVLNRQDAQELGIDGEDLKAAYFALAETLGRKPSRVDLDSQGEYKSAVYAQVFGSWVAFLREVGEYTEASYHYPQGVHVGHILSILKVFGSGQRTGSHFDDQYIRLRGDLGEGRIAGYRRQVKYKLLAAMELGIITDDRDYSQADYVLELTPLGRELYAALQPILGPLDLGFSEGEGGVPSTRMRLSESEYNRAIRDLVRSNADARQTIYGVFLKMHAVQQMLAFLYHVCRKAAVPRSEIYEQFFQAPFVKQFCDQEGIEEATDSGAEHRCPFLLNILAACNILTTERDRVIVERLALVPALVKPHQREEHEVSLARLRTIVQAWPHGAAALSPEDISIVRELFGSTFLTPEYYLHDLVVFEG